MLSTEIERLNRMELEHKKRIEDMNNLMQNNEKLLQSQLSTKMQEQQMRFQSEQYQSQNKYQEQIQQLRADLMSCQTQITSLQ